MAAPLPRGFRRLSVVAALSTYLLVVLGGIVRVTGSGLGCGDTDQWPLCHGALLPPWERTALIEFTHRWLAAVTTALVLAVAVMVLLRYRQNRRLRNATLVAVILFVVQIVLGAVTVIFTLPAYVILAHLANALLLLGMVIFIAVTALTEGTPRELQWASPNPSAKWALGASAATYVLALSGALVVANTAGGACAGWPLCGNGLEFSGSGLAALNLLHRGVAGIVVVLVGYSMARLLRDHKGDRAVSVTAMVVNVLLLLQVIAGALVVKLGLPPWIRGLHLALASALWGTVVLVTLLARSAAGGSSS